MYGGIDQLVDTYKGNPQPLAAEVKKDQQSQPPGEIPPDLEEAIALQQIAKLRQGAQNQQAMQAGGAQPSVVEKLRQMLAGYQAQAQVAAPAQGAPAPQGQPVMAARGGSIDQLMSNLGQYYAGGGIVAFNGEDESKVKDPNEDKRSLLEKFFYSNITPAEQRRMAALQAIAAAKEAPAQQEAAPQDALAPKTEPVQQEPLTPQQIEAMVKEGPLRQVTQRELAESYNRKRRAQREEDEARPKESYGAALEKFLYSNITPAEQRRREALQAAANERAGIKPMDAFPDRSNRAALNAADAGLRSQPGASNRALLNAADAGLRSQPAESAPAVVKPTGAGVAGAGIAGGPAVTAVEKLDPESLRGLTEAYIRGEFKLSPEAERDKAVEFARKTMGLDALLGEKERRANEREAMIKRAQGERMPDWVEALAGARKQTRGGLGSLLGQMGDTAQATREAYANQDIKYQAELAQLRDVITDAKISGNKELVKEGMAAYKEIDARRRAAATNATSLVKTDEDVAMRKQIAKDEAARRAQSASQHADNKNLALEERKRQFNEELLRKIREKDVDRANKIETAIAKRVGMIDIELQSSKLKPEVEADLLRRRNAIVKQVQAEYPPIKPEKPSESQFLTAARKANPGVSDADLKAYYNKTYGS